jgi:transcriptional regulator with XRE-family HTH domain
MRDVAAGCVCQVCGIAHAPGFPMITGPQIRRARRLIGWTVSALANTASVSAAIVERAEQSSGVPSITLAQAQRIQLACEEAGIVFGAMGEVTLLAEPMRN